MTILDPELTFKHNPGQRTANKELIIHHAAGDGDIESIHRQHCAKGWAGVAYHYYVRKSGFIYKGRPEEWKGGHTENRGNALGICFEGNFEVDIMPEAQFNSGRELIADILGKYPDMQVYRHRDFDATACPGSNFPFEEMTEMNIKKEPSDWALLSCTRAIERGLIQGDGNGNYGWHEPLTLERALVLFDRLGLLE